MFGLHGDKAFAAGGHLAFEPTLPVDILRAF
jgi:hypothetical protein